MPLPLLSLYKTLNIYDVFRPLHFYLQFFGLAVYGERKNENGETFYNITVPSFARYVLVIAFYSFSFYHSLKFFNFVVSWDLFVIGMIDVICSYILSNVEILMGFIFYKDIIRLFESFLLIDTDFQKLNIPIFTMYR